MFRKALIKTLNFDLIGHVFITKYTSYYK